KRLSGRTPGRAGAPNPSSCDRARHHEPARLGKAGCPDPLSPPADDPRDPNPRLEPPAQNPTLPADTFPPRRLILPRDRQPPQERLRRRCASAARLLTRAAPPQTTAAIRAGRRMGHAPKPLRNRSATPKPDRLTSGPDTGKGAQERARAGEGRRARTSRCGGRTVAGLRRCRNGGRQRSSAPGCSALEGACWGNCWPPIRATGGRGCPVARAMRPCSPATGTSPSTRVPGLVTLTRAWYHCAECGHGLAPRDAELGVAGASMSPGLAAMNDRAAAAVPFAQAAALLEEHAGVRLTVKGAERAAEASGGAVAAAVRDRAGLIAARKLVPLPPSPLPDKLYAVIDGTGVPMTSRETAGRDGKGEDGRARTREVKLAVFFTQDKLDKDGYPIRNRDSSSVIATFEPASVLADLVKAEGIRRGADHVRQLTILGDGAAWIWNIATAKFPEATQIVDLFHAREHLHDLARVLEFMLGSQKDAWLAARMEDPDYGDIDGICNAARKYPLAGVKKDELATALGYFENNAPRMRYHWFRQCGLFVGSGVVEASCKTVIGQRLRQSGMHWTINGADAIIALRCREASSTWEAICNSPHTQTRTA